MATTDNKVLTGAGVEQLSQLVKNAIAQGGGTEYSAGPGIEISSENEIASKFPSDIIAFMSLQGGSQLFGFPFANVISSTVEGIVENLKKYGYCFAGSGIYCYMSEIVVAAGLPRTTSVAYIYGIQNGVPAWAYTSASSLQVMVGSLIFFDGNTTFQLIPYNQMPTFGNFLGFKSQSGLTSTTLAKGIDEVNNKIPTIATTQTPGTVIPDGTTITIDSNGVISSQGGSSYTFTSGLTENNGTVSWDLNDRITKGNGNSGAVSIGGGTANGTNCIAIGSNSRAQTYNYGAIAIGTQARVYNFSNSYEGTDSLALGKHALVESSYQTAIGGGTNSGRIHDGNRQFDIIISNNTNKGLAFGATDKYMSGDLYVGCTDYTTTSSGLQTANCGGQKVFYGTLTSTDTAPTVEGAINWVYK